MEFLSYNAYRRPYTLTPPWSEYPPFIGLSKYEGHYQFIQDDYPQFPTPPHSTSPPTLYLDPSHSEKDRDVSSAAPESSRTTSVIMRVADKSIVEVRPKSTSIEVEEEFVCRWLNCSKMFDTLESLAAHVTQTHAVASGDGLYYCKWEGCSRMERGFNARYKMLVHVRTHTKEKPHQCPQCEKSFSRAENLKIHTRSHSGEKPYVCPVEGCTKAYSNSSDRFKHTRTHLTEKPYVCKVPGCQKRYTDPSSLRKHVKTFKHTSLIEENKAKTQSGDHLVDQTPPKETGAYRISRDSEEAQPRIPYPEFTSRLIERTPPCSCSYECLNSYQHPEMYKLDGYYDGVFLSYDRRFHISDDAVSPAPPAPYWGVQSKIVDTHCMMEPMDLDMDMDVPLDLSVHRHTTGHR